MKNNRESRNDIRLLADISDGKHVFEGTVVNVSRHGLKIMEIPQKFDFYAEKFTAVITEKDKNFKLFLNPRWSRIERPYKEIGFKIISPPLEWIKFINELEEKEIPLSSVNY
ncbi:MAG: PilZ domain-containing protein [Desulfurivibrionaceae bacterium]